MGTSTGISWTSRSWNGLIGGSPTHTRRNSAAPAAPGRIPLDHVGRTRRGLLPEVVERRGEFAVKAIRAGRLADEIPLHVRDV